MLYLNTIDPALYKVLQDLCRLHELSNFVLVGGTSLSLQIGHRKSDDLDFFTDRSFDIFEVKNAILQYNPGIILLDEKKHGFSCSLPLHGNPADMRKLDLYNWAVKFIRPVKQEGGVRLASLEDIAAFKLDAICHRKEKKDYVDIAILSGKFSFGQMLDFYKEKFPMNDKRIVLSQILDIDGWENSVEPVMLIDMSPEKAFGQIKEKVIAFSAEQIKAKGEKDAERLKRAAELLNKKG
ncbi:nucleotidyl transferase AbiEii/AbiGii toxin family protein [Parafilimonas sp.]|uniref:nucleotidyl transferase AbiEii/AbiGii toxin family protein n=1 Tax=Parafilimonas sp. TaxID=1969739 RepID=UPI0039E54F24